MPFTARQRMMQPKRQPVQPTVSGAPMPAPVGGWNSVDAVSKMPDGDCIYLYNMIPFRYGLRVRLGYKTWCPWAGVALEGMLADELAALFDGSSYAIGVKTIIPFTGSLADGSNDRLFACNALGIFDISDEGSDGAQVHTFAAFGLNSGKGISAAFSNSAGHFVAYADGQNGYILYSENTDSWVKVERAATTAWVTGTTYVPGDTVTNGGLSYRCTAGGVAGATGPTGGGTGIVDGGVTWSFYYSITGVDPSTFRHVMVWKNRIWFTQADSSVAWYLPVNSVAGQAYPVYFGPRFKFGGSLVGLWSWTLDGGQGVDDMLVGISTAGDVVVYQGSDPASANTFGLRGVWFVGAVPPGRRIASDFGGDLFILSMTGCVPLSKLVAGGLIRDPNLYATQKIANLFNALMSERRTLEGWELRIHPGDNTLLITIPPAPGGPYEQLSMSLATMGWARHQGVPMACTESWHGKLFFGTTDGRVCVNDGYVDAVQTDGTGGTAINWKLLTAYQNLNNARMKRVELVRPHFVTTGTVPGYSVAAKYDFNLTNEDLTATTVPTTVGAWDVGRWDVAKWDESRATSEKIGGTTGVGVNVALLLKGSSTDITTFTGFDVMFNQGGFL